MSSVLKQTLKSLCCNHGWCYVIFWHFNQRNPQVLSMEDVYYEEPMEQTVKDMILLIPMMDEGSIRIAALTGNHQWLFLNAAQDILQDKQEFHGQFCSGIKTIAIVPVGSRGVLQFGSTQKILQNSEFLDQIKSLFQSTDSSNRVLETPFSCLDAESYDLNNLFDSLLPLENNCDSATLDSICGFSFDEILMDNRSSSTNSAFSSLTSETHNSQIFAPEESYRPDSVQEDYKFDDFGLDILNQYSLDNLQELLTETPKQSNGHQELGPLCSIFNPNLDNSYLKSHQDRSLMAPNGDNDLFDALGFNFGQTISFPAATCVSESRTEIKTPFTDSSKKGLFSELGINELISSVSSYSSPAISQSKRRKLEISSSGSQNLIQNPLLDSWSKGISDGDAFKTAGLWIEDGYSVNNGDLKTGNGISKKSDKPEKVMKKRAKPGESSRPRPKDRQAIQDRLKELRGIIPNGAKCSIDALLDLTIKHMLFLQNVSKYADKLKQCYKPKLIKQENGREFTERVGNGNGATWAFEVGDESTLCPIIVEDLNSPGQMLVEMLCDERGHFLEIADVIKSLGLSILKGVMETRDCKTWAHFIIEAKRHITRLDVFWSLVHVLHQTDTKNGVSVRSIPATLSETLQ